VHAQTGSKGCVENGILFIFLKLSAAEPFLFLHFLTLSILSLYVAGFIFGVEGMCFNPADSRTEETSLSGVWGC